MIWHEIRDPKDPELDRLAERYHLHPLHIEDCRHRNQSAKVEQQNEYIFVVAKPLEMNDDFELDVSDLDIFVGRDWLITVHESDCPTAVQAMQRVRERAEPIRSDQLLHRILDELIDSYLPILDRLSDRIDSLEDRVLESPDPEILQGIFSMKRMLIEMRRVLTNTRDVLGHIQRIPDGIIATDMQPFFRDVYDHVARSLDLVETYRDLVTGSMDIYLSSVSNRTNQVMKVLTVISTVTLPAILISGIYGMNVKSLPFAESNHAWWIVTAMIVGASAFLYGVLKLFRWL